MLKTRENLAQNHDESTTSINPHQLIHFLAIDRELAGMGWDAPRAPPQSYLLTCRNQSRNQSNPSASASRNPNPATLTLTLF